MSQAIRLMPARPQPALPSEPFHRWTLADGSHWAEFCRTDTGYLVRFAAYADFEIAADGTTALCWPVPGVDRPTIEHLCDNQVRPLMLSRQHRAVFHGAAVAVEDGAIAFLGASGRGKSTLAAAFASAGHPFLTDDALLLEADGDGGYRVQPGQASLRLWDDSRDRLLQPGAATAPAVRLSAKQRFLAAGGLPHMAEPRRLRAAYFLLDEDAPDVAIARIEGAQGLASWTLQAFVLDVDDRAWLARQFVQDADIATRVPSFTLDFPRRFDDLEGLRAELLAHIARDAP